MTHSDFKVLICGSDDAAQVATALFAARYETFAMSLTTATVQEWKAALGEDEFELAIPRDAILGDSRVSPGGSRVVPMGDDEFNFKLVKSKPAQITDDPSVAKDVDLVVLVSSPLDQGKYLEALAPHMRPKTIVAAMPLRPDADHMFERILGDKANTVIFCGYEALPWTTRITEWGRKACIIGTQDEILAAVVPRTAAGQAIRTLRSLEILGIANVKAGQSVWSTFLRNPAYICNPGIMYGRWCPAAWDGQPVESAPLFYHGLDDYTETVLLQMGVEAQLIRKKIVELAQVSDLTDVPELKQCMTSAFASSISDPSTLQTCFRSNSAYNNIKHACLEAEGGVVPDFQYRYLSEDVPIGLAFVKGLAQIFEIPTPTMDKVFEWAQKHIGLEIMAEGKLVGRDLRKTCAPQAVGITTESALLNATIRPEAGARFARALSITSSRSAPSQDRALSITSSTSALSQDPGATRSTSAPRKVLVVPGTAKSSCFYGWAIVWICTLCLIFDSPGGSTLWAMDGSPVRKDLDISRLEVGLLLLVTAVTSGPVQPLLGRLVDKHGARVCIPAAQVVLCLGLLWGSTFHGASHQYRQKGLLYAQAGIVLILLRSVSKGCMTTFTHACVQQWFEERRGRATWLMNTFHVLGVAILLPLMWRVADDFSWHTAMWMGADYNLAMAPLSLLLLRKRPESIGLHPDGRESKAIALDPDALEAQSENQTRDMQSENQPDEMPANKAALFPQRGFRTFWMCSFVFGFVMSGSTLDMTKIVDHSIYLASGRVTPLTGNQAFTLIFEPLALAGVCVTIVGGELMDYVAPTMKRLPLGMLCFSMFLLAFTNLSLIVLDTPSDAVLLGIARGLCVGIHEILLSGGLIFSIVGVPRSRIGEAIGYMQMAMIMGTGVGPLVFSLYLAIFGNYWGILLISSLPALALGTFLMLRLVEKV
jgi:MFS family permease